MSRKDYREAARIVREASYLSAEARAGLVSDLVTFFADENSKFSPSKFRAACKPESAGYPQDNPCARLDALNMLSGLGETRQEPDMLACMRERIHSGGEPLASRKAAEPERRLSSDVQGANVEDSEADDLLAWFESGYSHGFEAEVVRSCRTLLGRPFPADLRR